MTLKIGFGRRRESMVGKRASGLSFTVAPVALLFASLLSSVGVESGRTPGLRGGWHRFSVRDVALEKARMSLRPEDVAGEESERRDRRRMAAGAKWNGTRIVFEQSEAVEEAYLPHGGGWTAGEVEGEGMCSDLWEESSGELRFPEQGTMNEESDKSSLPATSTTVHNKRTRVEAEESCLEEVKLDSVDEEEESLQVLDPVTESSCGDEQPASKPENVSLPPPPPSPPQLRLPPLNRYNFTPNASQPSNPPSHKDVSRVLEEYIAKPQSRAMELLHGSRLPEARDLIRTYTEALERLERDTAMSDTEEEEKEEWETKEEGRVEVNETGQQSSFKVGDDVITADGRYGSVVKVRPDLSCDVFLPGLPVRLRVRPEELRKDETEYDDTDSVMADEKNATSSVFCEVQKPWKPGVPSSYSKIPVEAESTLGGGDDKTAGEEEVKRLRRDRAQLWRAARAGDVGRVRELISQGHDPNSGNPRLLEATAMHYASLYGHREVMSILVDAGANPSATNRWGATPLHFAAFAGQLESMEMLLQGFRCSVNAVDLVGSSPLHFAALAGRLAPVRLLVEAGADVFLKDEDGDTPLDNAEHSARTTKLDGTEMKGKCATSQERWQVVDLLRDVESARMDEPL
mmetsp:Transcript_10038/g.22886  ORF Transcript_10038/g.22886 Transcript_10038/m.22886 type:complete len:631 (-) Transcript_10038:13-1905(-)